MSKLNLINPAAAPLYPLLDP